MTKRLSIWCLYCLANLCELDQRHSRLFLYCPVCNQPRHSFTLRVNTVTQQALVHPQYHEYQSQFANAHPANLPAAPQSGYSPLPLPTPITSPRLAISSDHPDPQYQSPYGDHPQVYRSPMGGYGTVQSDCIGFPHSNTNYRPNAAPQPAPQPVPQRLNYYGKSVVGDHPIYGAQPAVPTAPTNAGISKPAPKKRGKPLKALDELKSQAMLQAVGLKGSTSGGAATGAAAWVENKQGDGTDVKHEPKM